MHTNGHLVLHIDVADTLLSLAPELKADPEQPYGPEGQPGLKEHCGVVPLGFVHDAWGGLELFVNDPGNGIFSAVRLHDGWEDVVEQGARGRGEGGEDTEEMVVFHRARGWAF